MDHFLEVFARRFTSLDADNLYRLDGIYSPDIHFQDPLHSVRGLNELHAYFTELYANVQQLDFNFQGYDQVSQGEGYLRWVMRYRHPRLRGGQLIEVTGCSHLRWNDKVYYHRDYFDAGALLYEHVPLLGAVIRLLKRRLA